MKNSASDIEKFGRSCASQKNIFYYEFVLSLFIIPVCGLSGFDMEQPLSITNCYFKSLIARVGSCTLVENLMESSFLV